MRTSLAADSATDFYTSPARTQGPYGWGRALLALFLTLLGCGLVVGVAATALAVVGQSIDGAKPPILGVVQLAALGLAAPVIIVVARLMFAMRLEDLFSALPGIRWPLLLQCTAIAFVGMGLYTAIVTATHDGGVTPLTGTVVLAIVAAILLIPFQALAEELLFRAFGPQVIHGVIGVGAARLIATAAVFSAFFASMHGAGNVVSWATFFVFGLVFAGLVWVTAGIEASLALHAVNNVLFVVGGLLVGKDLTATQSNVKVDAAVLAQLGVFVAVAVVLALLARRRAARAGSVASSGATA